MVWGSKLSTFWASNQGQKVPSLTPQTGVGIGVGMSTFRASNRDRKVLVRTPIRTPPNPSPDLTFGDAKPTHPDEVWGSLCDATLVSWPYPPGTPPVGDSAPDPPDPLREDPPSWKLRFLVPPGPYPNLEVWQDPGLGPTLEVTWVGCLALPDPTCSGQPNPTLPGLEF